jgi:CDGSH-type Zn-finger protein
MATRIVINRTGSIKVEGEDVAIVDQDGVPFDLGGRTRVSLCRCGKSRTMPFCDHAHREIGFVAEHVCRALPPAS